VGEGIVNDDGRYWAFISYSHRDAAFGRRLHRRLEAYSLPRRLVGRATAQGSISRRLVPVFRDREEFPAAHDLSAEVLSALRISRCLIVVCSPAAAASPWVAREVELFRALHPGRPILAAIREGDPASSIPEVLRHAGPSGARIEPLAADFRRGHDGWELGLLKLVAGVAGVGLDELIQRDSQRHTQRVTAVTAAALALVLVMAVLTAFALSARSEAERQRAAAEGIVKFMHTDLRKELKGVGRLDLMAAVNQTALRYYDSEIDHLSAASLARRAQVLQAIGEDDEDRGDRRTALALFQATWQTTNGLLAEAPNDPERMFDHAQSEYWLGYDAYMRNELASAREHFEIYLALAHRMLAIAPYDPRYWRELSFAEGNLCSVALHPPVDAVRALGLCSDALKHMRIAAHGRPAPAGIASDLADKESWMGSAYHAEGDETHALQHWLAQEQILKHLIAADPLNKVNQTDWISLQRLLARHDAAVGQRLQALERLRKAATLLDDMRILDPLNKSWAHQRHKLDDDITKLNLH
jgi:hypothetical protein